VLHAYEEFDAADPWLVAYRREFVGTNPPLIATAIVLALAVLSRSTGPPVLGSEAAGDRGRRSRHQPPRASA
jgi:hypothetical protein